MSTYDDPRTWRLETVGGIPYRMVGQAGSFGKEEASASAVYLVEARNLLAFALEVLPYPTQRGDRIVYIGGASLPGTGVSGMRCESVKWKAHIDGKPVDPFSADTVADNGTYGAICEVTVEYKTSKEDDENDDDKPETFLEISGSATGDYINTTASGGLKWSLEQGQIPSWVPYSDEYGEPIPPEKRAAMAGANKNPDVPVVIIVPQIEWSVKWPRIPWTKWRGLYIGRLRRRMGMVNSTTFNLLSDAPAETILFLGWDYGESYTWRTAKGGQPPVNITLKFLEKNVVKQDGTIIGHNHFWKPGEGWTRVKMDKAGNVPAYVAFDMNTIFLTKPQNDDVVVIL